MIDTSKGTEQKQKGHKKRTARAAGGTNYRDDLICISQNAP